LGAEFEGHVFPETALQHCFQTLHCNLKLWNNNCFINFDKKIPEKNKNIEGEGCSGYLREKRGKRRRMKLKEKEKEREGGGW